MNPEEVLNPEERLVVEGHVFVGTAGDTAIGTVSGWNPRADKVANLADYIEAAFGFVDNVGIHGPMRIIMEKMPL